MELYCKNCDITIPEEKANIKMISYGEGKTHKKASCYKCGSFITFLPHSEPALHFGKYKGKTIKEIAEIDTGYLQWALKASDEGTLRLSKRIKTVIEETLLCTAVV